MSLRDSLRKQSITREEQIEISDYIDYEAVKTKVLNGLSKGFKTKIAEKDYKQTFHYLGTVSKFHYNADTELNFVYTDTNNNISGDRNYSDDSLSINTMEDLSALLMKLSYDLKSEFDEIYYQLREKYYDIEDIPALVKDTKKTGNTFTIKVFANLFCNRNGVVK